MQGPVGKNRGRGNWGHSSKTGTRRFSNVLSRTAVRVKQNLGIIFAEDRSRIKKVRNDNLEVFDDYYENCQYDKLPPWDEASSRDGEYIAIRKRQPRIKYNFGKVLVDRVSAKLVGEDTFPKLKVEDDPDTSMFIDMIIKTSRLRSRISESVKLMGRSGSVLIRYYVVNGDIQIESYHAKHCYPEFLPNGDLSSVRIQYVYEDTRDLDGSGKPKDKWYRLDLGPNADILYDNPLYSTGAEPQFQVVDEMSHALGFVQAEWLRTTEDKHSPDGTSLIGDCLDFIDELNYSLSQASQAVAYGQEPQLAISGMDTDEIDGLIKSSTKCWNLGREGKAEFVETQLEAVKQAGEMRDKIRLAIQDVARVTLSDPEKMAQHAQSGKALEILHGPMGELISELRPHVEEALINLITKIAVTLLQLRDQGLELAIDIPEGYQPQSLSITVTWPPIFPITIDDLQKKVAAAAMAVTSRLLSEESATRYLAPDFGIENVEEELDKIKAQPIISPFGSSFGGGAPGGGFGGNS